MSDNGSHLGEKLIRLAENVLDDLLCDDKPPLDQRIDGLKHVGALFLGLKKVYKPSEDDDGDGSSLKAMRERVRAAEEGK